MRTGSMCGMGPSVGVLGPRFMRTRHALWTVAVVLLVTSCSSTGVKSSTMTSSSEPSVVDTTGLAAMHWEYRQGFQPAAATRELELNVHWVGCASGVAPVDPKPVVRLTPDHVYISVWAVPPAGRAFNCQSNKAVDISVSLSETLGSRDVAQGEATLR